MKKIIFLVFILLLANFSFGQDKGKLSIQMGCNIDNGSLDSATITIFENGYKILNIENVTKINLFKLCFNSEFLIKYSKPNYTTKKVIINTQVPNHKKESDFEPYEFDLKLFKNENSVAFLHPIAYISYSNEVDEFDYKVDYTKGNISEEKTSNDYPNTEKKFNNYKDNSITCSVSETKTSNYYYNTGVKFYKENDTRKALDNFNMALYHNPNDIDALYNSAVIYLHKNNIDSACYYLYQIKELGKNDGKELMDKWCK